MAKSKSTSRAPRSTGGRAAASTTDHDKIRGWVEGRGGTPACVKGTKRGKSCLLRIDFPGGAGEESLEKMSWNDFFDVMDQRGLVFLYQKGKSTFNKIVEPESVKQPAQKGRGGTAGAKKTSTGKHGRGSR